ncbi:MAG: tRNA threonylcarbamoyladenosine biosynthesis protein TsaB [Glaciecola sp.]|jgi:tRNA threonylcarbamoyladenosine biosynthesis protein TsaB
MRFILNIETSGKNCSVALANGSEVLLLKEVQSEQFVHAEQLHVLIEHVLSKSEVQPSSLECIAISEGPGSYTGLRIGLAAAKGLAYTLGIPLVGVSSLKVLANAARKLTKVDLLIPMMDARRMEVYTAVYDMQLKEISPAVPVVVDECFLNNYIGQGIAVFGDGAAKCEAFTKDAIFLPGVIASAFFMSEISWALFVNKQFVDLAYFEPNYLKDFQAGKPKNMFL